MTTQWENYLGEFGKDLLNAVGGWDEFNSGSCNPITDAIRQGDFVATYGHMVGFNRISVTRAVVVCQMAYYDNNNGPEGDGKCKGLRRHWYVYFKSEFTQPFALQMGDFKVNDQGVKEVNDNDWSSRLSVVYSELVDTGEITYKDLWVEDTSRMFTRNWETLYEGFKLLICVEKDSLFDDFKVAAQAIGATALYSGKGKTSKAATEKVLRETFGWTQWADPFEDEPLIVLHVTDFDYDGQQVIGPTFAEQARRYTSNIIEARIGVNPKDVKNVKGDLASSWYNIKISNKSYQEWASELAIFQFVCPHCHTELVGQGDQERDCPECGKLIPELKRATAHGYEVEALKTGDYYPLIVDALLRILPFGDIVMRLREDCVADVAETSEKILAQVVQDNQNYQALLKEIQRLEALRVQFEGNIKSEISELAEGHESDWEDEDEDPTIGEFKIHMTQAAKGSWGYAWRPFNKDDRTQSMIDWVLEEYRDKIEELKDSEINWAPKA